jgi:uncharacterized delta-60 repeat protein
VTALRCLLLTLVLALLAAAPSSALVAPGAVTFPVSATARQDTVDAYVPTLAAPRPDGGAVLVSGDPAGRLVLAAVRRDGTLDPAFGTGGIAQVALPAPWRPSPLELLLDGQGRPLVVFAGAARARNELPQLQVARLTAAGALDTSYGDGGVATPGIQGGCGGGCTPAALAPDGALLVTGVTGTFPATPNPANDQTWVVRRLSAAGAVDAGFGAQGTAAIATVSAAGHSVAVRGDGGVVTVGTVAGHAQVARLTAAGTADPVFHGGAPLDLGAAVGTVDVVGRAGGAADVLAYDASAGRIVRVTAAGVPDPAFGAGGSAVLPFGYSGTAGLVARPDGSALLLTAPFADNSGAQPALTAYAVSALGAVDAPRTIRVPFAGGLASVAAHIRPVIVQPLEQSRYGAGRAVLRPDGSLFVPGSVAVTQYTGEGTGFGHGEVAAASLTPDLAPDPAFGGAARPAWLAIRVPAQRARVDAQRRFFRVAIDATTSGPGLALLTVRAGRRVVAQSTAPVLRSGRQRLPALLTVTGRRSLRSAHGVRVTVTARFRDLVGQEATATARGRLR